MGKYKSWSEKEFRAYLFLYAADSNFEYNVEEKSFIESRFNSKTLETIKSETDDLNDFQRSKIITDYIKLKNIKQKKLDQMLDEIKEVYLADGRFDQYEQSIFKMLTKKMKAK